MTHTVFHAESSARKWGGKPEDYLPIHDWLDATKEMFCDFRHRALRHHSQGVYEAERVFGHAIVNSDGKTVPVRYIAEQHIKEDCGGIVPSVSDWLKRIPGETWMSRGYQLKDSEIECSARDSGEGRTIVELDSGRPHVNEHQKCHNCGAEQISTHLASVKREWWECVKCGEMACKAIGGEK